MNPAQTGAQASRPARALPHRTLPAPRRWPALPRAAASALVLALAAGIAPGVQANGAPAASGAAPTAGAANLPVASSPGGATPRTLPPVRPTDRLVPKDCLYTNSTPHSVASREHVAALVPPYRRALTPPTPTLPPARQVHQGNPAPPIVVARGHSLLTAPEGAADPA